MNELYERFSEDHLKHVNACWLEVEGGLHLRSPKGLGRTDIQEREYEETTSGGGGAKRDLKAARESSIDDEETRFNPSCRRRTRCKRITRVS